MPVYKWRRRVTENFGEVSVPFAHLTLLGKQGHFDIALQVDSGATISLLRRSAADYLGLELTSGRKVSLSGVGESQIFAHVHTVPTLFASDLPAIHVSFAIAEVETVPNLLGRIGVFDVLQVDFDSTLEETRITGRWLDEGGRKTWEWLIETERHIYERLPKADWSANLNEAITRFFNRADMLIACMSRLAKLHTPYAAPLLIRSMLELSAQFEYLMLDPENRASQYIDFSHITRKKQQDAIIKGPEGPYFDLIRQSAKRTEGEARVNADYEKVKSKYQTTKGADHKTWYCMHFKDLVGKLPNKPVDWMDEYQVFYSQFSAWAHADPFATTQDNPKDGHSASTALMQCYVYLARMLLRTAEAAKMLLTASQLAGLEELSKGLLQSG